MNMDALRHIKYVFAAVDHGSMRRTALKFGVQESTVSRHIRTIEQHLGIQLFERNSGGVKLTAEGEKWLRTIRSHVENLEEALLQSSRHGEDSRILSIGLCAPVGQEFLLRLIDRFKHKYPAVKVVIREGSCRRQAAAIRRRHLDVAFMCACCEARACSNETVWEEGIAVLLPTSHRLAAQESLEWEDLAGERLLVPMGAEGPLLEACFLRPITACVRNLVIEQCHGSQATVIVNVRLGKGFALSGASFAKGITIERTVWRPILGRNSHLPIKAVWLQSNPRRPVLQFIAVAQKIAAERRSR